MTLSRRTISNTILRLSGWWVVLLVVFAPFSAFLSITLGLYGLNQAIVISAIVLWLLYAIFSHSIPINPDRTNVLFAIIILLTGITTIFIQPENSAVLFGFKNNILPLLIYFVCQLPFSQKSTIKKRLVWLVVIPGLVVSLLAILQSFVVSPKLLESIGYTSTTINPRQIVDGSLSFYRAFSTLGGPNQLGAYLLVPLGFALIYGVRQKLWGLLIGAVVMLSGIGLSFSRSAWIGALVVMFFSIYILLSNKKRLYFVLVSLVVLIGLVGSVFALASTNRKFQNVILHGSIIDNQVMGSDQQRIASLSRSAALIAQQPFGHGLGSAGPASYQSSRPVITENWYLQIAYEIGVFGVLLYIFAFASLLVDFYRNKINPLASSLFVVTIGVLVANLFLHTWADSTISILAFALYGFYKGSQA